MSLYDDYKKKEEEKKEVTSVVSNDQELYDIMKEPFYKRKEFFILLSTIIVVVTIMSVLIYVPKFEMENLKGKDEAYAKAYSENYNLKLSVKKEFNEDYSKDQIYEQSLKANEEFKEGIVLEVSISKGPDFEKQIDYPDFSDMTYEEATKWKKKNFAKGTKIEEQYSDNHEAGVFIKESSTEENKKGFKRNTEVTITYSKGVAKNGGKVKVADMSGKPVAEVASWAYKNEIVLEVTEIFDKHLAVGTVLEQSVKAGEELEKGATFTVTSNVGPGVVVPNFYGLNKSSATTAALKAGVTVTERSVYSSGVVAGGLISQSVGAGTKIKESTTVELVYSLGSVPINDFTGSSYVDVVATINTLNESGANIIINAVYVDNPGGHARGTVASNSHSNSFVNPGTSITVNLYR